MECYVISHVVYRCRILNNYDNHLCVYMFVKACGHFVITNGETKNSNLE